MRHGGFIPDVAIRMKLRYLVLDRPKTQQRGGAQVAARDDGRQGVEKGWREVKRELGPLVHRETSGAGERERTMGEETAMWEGKRERRRERARDGEEYKRQNEEYGDSLLPEPRSAQIRNGKDPSVQPLPDRFSAPCEVPWGLERREEEGKREDTRETLLYEIQRLQKQLKEVHKKVLYPKL